MVTMRSQGNGTHFHFHRATNMKRILEVEMFHLGMGTKAVTGEQIVISSG